LAWPSRRGLRLLTSIPLLSEMAGIAGANDKSTLCQQPVSLCSNVRFLRPEVKAAAGSSAGNARFDWILAAQIRRGFFVHLAHRLEPNPGLA